MPSAVEKIARITKRSIQVSVISDMQVNKALGIARQFGSIDGEHHKTWVIDQMVRALTGPGYAAWVRDFDEDGPDTYAWDTGIAP
jgi:hypothetical protein